MNGCSSQNHAWFSGKFSFCVSGVGLFSFFDFTWLDHLMIGMHGSSPLPKGWYWNWTFHFHDYYSVPVYRILGEVSCEVFVAVRQHLIEPAPGRHSLDVTGIRLRETLLTPNRQINLFLDQPFLSVLHMLTWRTESHFTSLYCESFGHGALLTFRSHWTSVSLLFLYCTEWYVFLIFRKGEPRAPPCQIRCLLHKMCMTLTPPWHMNIWITRQTSDG